MLRVSLLCLVLGGFVACGFAEPDGTTRGKKKGKGKKGRKGKKAKVGSKPVPRPAPEGGKPEGKQPTGPGTWYCAVNGMTGTHKWCHSHGDGADETCGSKAPYVRAPDQMCDGKAKVR